MKFSFPSLTKDALVNTTGTVFNAFIGLVFFAILSRSLGPEKFGIFAAVQALLIVLSDIFDLGTNNGILRFLPQIGSDQKTQGNVLKTALGIKLIIGLTIFFAGFILSKILSLIIFKSAEASSITLLAFLILPTLLLGFSVSCLQARHQFVKAAVLNIAANIFRLIFLIFLILSSSLTVFSALAIFALTPVIGFLISPLFFSFAPIILGRIEWKFFKEFLSFNKWITVAFSTAAIQARIDNLFLIRLSNSFETGLYAASSRLLSIYPQISGALSTAYAPSFSEAEKKNKGREIFKKTILQTTILAAIGLVPIIFASPIISLIYGKEYLPALRIFQILYLGMFFIILSVPSLTAIIYFLAKPKFYFLLTLFQLLVTIGGNILLIPRYQAQGAALTFTVGIFLVYLTATVYSKAKLNEKT